MGLFENEVNNIVNCNKCKQSVVKYNKTFCGSVNGECQSLFKKYKTQAAEKCKSFKKIEITDYRKITLDRALEFMLAGQAEFKIVSGKTGKEFYYRIIKKKANEYNGEFSNKFIYWLYGGESFESIKYLGSIFYDKDSDELKFSKGLAGSGYRNSKIVISILYLLNKVYKGKFNTNIQIYHNNKCGKCGRQLTDVRSIITGLDINCKVKLDIFDN